MSTSGKDHPYWALGVSGVIFLGPQILFLPLFIVHAAFFFVLMILGFGISGIVGGASTTFPAIMS
jgi:hypothetical protein